MEQQQSSLSTYLPLRARQPSHKDLKIIMKTRTSAVRDSSAAYTRDLPRTPLDSRRWPTEPSSLDELETTWIPATRVALLEWLAAARDKTHHVSEAQDFSQQAQRLANEWKRWVEYTNLETGEIVNCMEAEFNAAMHPLQDAYAKSHEHSRTLASHGEYRYAQAAWEDFLYFQNEWNRRGHVKDRTYYETAAELQAAHQRKTRKALDEETARTCIEAQYDEWRYYLIRRYNDFGLGSRGAIPNTISADDAHRYSQPPRCTTSAKLKSYKNRRDHLEKKFPGQKRRLTKSSRAEVESNRLDKRAPKSNERSVGVSGWSLDEKSFTREKDQRDQGYLADRRTKAVLPRDHKLHHGVLETSFDWPTSFDAKEWGNVVAMTASRRIYMYEKEDYKSSSGTIKRRYKENSQGQRIRLKEACGYKKMELVKEIPVWIHELNEDGSVKGRDRTGRWIGRAGTANEIAYINDPKYDEPVPDVRWRSENEFKVIIIDSKWPRITRRERHHQAGHDAIGEAIVDQLSDEEAPDCIRYDTNFCRSGNAQGISHAAIVAQNLPEDEHVSSDDDSDDEGDPFTESYLQCSKPLRKR